MPDDPKGRGPEPGDFDALARACLDNHAAILRLGTEDMAAASRLLLLALGQAIARRGAERGAVEPGDPIVGPGRRH